LLYTRLRGSGGRGDASCGLLWGGGGGGVQLGSKEMLSRLCADSSQARALHGKFHNTVLIINTNYEKAARSTSRFLRKVYGRVFPNIVIISEKSIPELNVQGTPRGILPYPGRPVTGTRGRPRTQCARYAQGRPRGTLPARVPPRRASPSSMCRVGRGAQAEERCALPGRPCDWQQRAP